MHEALLLEVSHLKKQFSAGRGKTSAVRAVDDVSFFIREGETLGLVGESGCGKTTLGRTLLRLYEPDGGRILYRGIPLFDGGPFPGTVRGRPVRADMRPYRSRLQLTFQDPASSLDPRMTAAESVGEAIDFCRPAGGRQERAERIEALLRRVGLGRDCLNRFPHELSGGQQQRVGIARALAAEPEFIVFDEPVSALDASVQSQVVSLLEDLQQDRGLTYLFIAHDLSVVRRIAHRVGVMYLGRLMELAPREVLYEHPAHPYTRALLAAALVPDPALCRTRRYELPSDGPGLRLPAPSGCPFHPRCPYAQDLCRRETPLWTQWAPGRFAACHLCGKI